MKKLILALCIMATGLTGCAYNSVTITADNGSTVNCTSTVDKPVDLTTALKGNVPLQGGTVNDSGTNIAQ